MHRVKRQDHAHVASYRKEVHLVAYVVWRNTGNEIGPVSVGDRLARNDLGVGQPRFGRQRHPRLLHELNLRRIDRRHRIYHLATGPQIELVNLYRKPFRTPPRFDSLSSRPKLPDILDRCLVRALEDDLVIGPVTRFCAHDVPSWCSLLDDFLVSRPDFLASRLRARASPNLPRRPSHSCRYWLTQASRSLKGSGQSE